VSWEQVQDAFQAAVARAARLDPALVIWGFQDVDQPPMDPSAVDGNTGRRSYIKLAMPSIATIGLDWVQATYDASRAAGQEIELKPQGTREMPLELQAFTTSTADGNAAIFLAERARTHLLLPSIRAILSAVGISLFDPGPVRYVPSVVAAGFRGRATCTLRTYVPALALAEYVTYIQTVSGTITTTGGAQSTPNVRPFSTTLP
jgi:hypothetical protein